MHEVLLQTIFYVFAGLTLFSAFMVVTQNNPVRCVLFLVLAFFCSSVLWILVEAEFLALILVLVYVGAVMTLFLFVVMMLNIDIESMRKHFLRYVPFALIIVAFMTALLFVTLPASYHQPEALGPNVNVNPLTASTATLSNTEELGLVLYTDYVYAFELAAVILLVAIIAAITLMHRQSTRSKRQNIRQQIMTRRDDRVTLVKMKSE